MKIMVSKLLFSKRGLSNIVATLLLVFLTVVAITVVASFVVPLVRDGLGGTDCFTYRDYYVFEEEFGYSCHTGDLYAVSVRNAGSAGENLTLPEGFVLVYGNEDERQSHQIINGASVDAVTMLDTSISSFAIPRQGEVRTYVYDAAAAGEFSGAIEYAEVHVLLAEDEVCDVSDRISINALCTGDRIL